MYRYIFRDETLHQFKSSNSFDSQNQILRIITYWLIKIEYRKEISSKNTDDDVTAQHTFKIDPFM